MSKTFEYTFDVVGLKFRLKKEVRQILAGKCPIRGIVVIREQENKYDMNAIAVHLPSAGVVGPVLAGKHIGYFRADAAEQIAPLMDDGRFVVKSAKLERIVDGADPCSEGKLHVIFTDKR